MTATLQDRAREARGYFELAQRPGQDSDQPGYWRTKDGRPEWIVDLCRAAHKDAGIMPDDERYCFIVEALDALAEADDPDEAEDEIEADVYTADLTAWLHSHVSRIEYLEEAIREHGVREGFAALQLAQYLERREVFGAVRGFLEEKADEGDEA